MPIDQWLLDMLVCPECRVKVSLKSDGSGLKCPACRRVYLIREGIPDMVVPNAIVEP